MKDLAKYMAPVIIGLCFVLFIYHGFFNPVSCNGIDVDSLYCALHPFSFLDIVGLLLIGIGGVLLSGLFQLFGLYLYNPANSSTWNIVSFIIMLLGVLLLWA